MLEAKVCVTCDTCRIRWWYAVGASQAECERKLIAEGWLLSPEKCPACKSGRKKQLKGEGK